MQAPANPPFPDVDPEEPTGAWYVPFTRRPWISLACLAAGLAVGVAASRILPPKYLARGRIILPNSSRNSALAGLAGTLGVPTGDTGSLPMFAAILRSEAMLTRLSDRTGLPRKGLRKTFSAKEDVKSNTIEITAMGPDRDRLLQTVRASIRALGEIASKVNLPLKQDQSTRLLASLANRQRDLAVNERALEAFLETAKTLPGGVLSPAANRSSGDSSGSGSNDAAVIAPGLGYRQQLSALEIQLRSIESSAAAIQSASKAQEATPSLDLPPVKLWAERIAGAQARLAELRPRYRANSPEVVEAEQALTGVQAQMRREVGKYLASVRASLTGPAQTLSVTRAAVESQITEVKKYVDAAPQEAITYLRLFRNVATTEAVVNQIRLMYEKARVEQTNDPNTWAVLDPPALDEEMDPRQLTRNLMVGGLLGLTAAYVLGARRAARVAR